MESENGLPGRTVIAAVAISLFLFLLLGLFLVLSWGAEGLPEDAPDLYDPAVIASYQLVKRVPYPTGRCQCESVVLAAPVAWIQGKDSNDRMPLSFVIGFLRDLTNQRIVVIVETFIHHAPPSRRSIRAWSDAGWISGKAASGKWTAYNGKDISGPMTRAEAREYLKPLYEAIRGRNGMEQ